MKNWIDMCLYSAVKIYIMIFFVHLFSMYIIMNYVIASYHVAVSKSVLFPVHYPTGDLLSRL